MLLLFLSILFSFTSCWENNLLGCYKNSPSMKSKPLPMYRRNDECLNNCGSEYYRYAYFRNGGCICGNYLGEEIANVTCSEYCSEKYCDGSARFTDVYKTGNLVPGPPRNLRIMNITETGCRLSWEEPESFIDLAGFLIKAVVLKTFSSYPLNNLEWTYSNNTYQANIITLSPATKYNISLFSLTLNDIGGSTSKVIETLIGEPDNLPSEPKIVDNTGTTITVRLIEATNNNGPITAYRIIVVDADAKQGFQKDHVLPYDEAKRNGLSYYIAAEIDPKDIDKDFVVGDGKTYRRYLNAPLDVDKNYNVLLAIVSEYKGQTKVAYSVASGLEDGVLILNVNDTEERGDSPVVIIGLSIAIGLLSFMLVAGIIGFIILKSRIINRRQRLSDNQELTLQGPMIEVENNGYIHEEEHTPAVSYYRNLKQKVKTIPSNQLKIEPTNLLGIGKYGKVTSGTIHENENLTTITAYTIYDKKMSQETRKSMLLDLDVLIKVGKHENLINLIGTVETTQMVVVVLEYASMNLKDLLLGSRDSIPGRFSNMSELQALKIATDICKGMAYLHSLNIIHKQLCARSILIANGHSPKIGSYGLAQYFSHNKIPDYTRWTALEVFKGQPHNPKSDVWSFACVLWEICVLGGTPYGNLSNNNDIPEKLSKGLRLPQLPYFSDELYQIMLDCWQLDCDERPKFAHLIDGLQNLKHNTLIPFLNFNLDLNFQYEQFYPDMELAVRPVF